MTPDQLRAAIAADCPHRLVDYDRHLAGRQPTPAFTRLWRIEHAISSRPALEQQLDDLDRQAHNTRSGSEALALLEQASCIRHQIAEGLT